MLTAPELQTILDGVAADYVKQLRLRVEAVDDDGVSLLLPIAPGLVHGGGVLCGQAIMSAADTAMLVAMISKLGEFKPMTTVQLQTSFLRPVPADTASVSVIARVLRFGKSLSYGEIGFHATEGKLVAHATTTYALL
ncbi:MAG: PaaI family thioesterase [Pseudomonadota bacterium]|nr:PaaI family thioesterase [Pseudomonadota bacterium]